MNIRHFVTFWYCRILKGHGLLTPPPNLRKILSRRLTWFKDHLKGEKQIWKNKAGFDLQVTIQFLQ